MVSRRIALLQIARNMPLKCVFKVFNDDFVAWLNTLYHPQRLNRRSCRLRSPYRSMILCERKSRTDHELGISQKGS